MATADRTRFQKLLAVWPLAHVDADPSDYEAEEVTAGLTAYLALWHPAVLCAADRLPQLVNPYDVVDDLAEALVLVPAPLQGSADPEWESHAISSGATLVVGASSLSDQLRVLARELGMPLSDDATARDFFALGLATLWWRIVSSHLGRDDGLASGNYAHAVQRAAQAAGYQEHIELLQEAFRHIDRARDSIYPVELYSLCFVLGTPEPQRLEPLLDRNLAFNLLATGEELHELRERHPDLVEHLRALIETDRCDLVGGEWRECRHTLLPINVLLWQLARGADAYRDTLRRQPAAYGRRSFGLAGYVPHLLNRMNTYYALHYSLDGALFPEHYEPKIRWEGVATASVEALTRLPHSLDEPVDVLAYGRAVAQSIASDHVPTTVWAYQAKGDPLWADLVARIAQYTNCFGRWCTLTDYFQTTDPTDVSSHQPEDGYRSAFLMRDHVAGHEHPVSRYLLRWRRDALLQAIGFWAEVARTLRVRVELPQELHRQGYAAGNGSADRSLLQALSRSSEQLANALLRSKPGDRGANTVRVLLNASAHTVQVPLSPAAPAPFAIRPLGQPYTIDPTARGAWAEPERTPGTVSVPGFGYCCVSGPSAVRTPLRIVEHGEQTLVIQNERYVVTLDRPSGMLRGFGRPGDRVPRVGCQLVGCGFPSSTAESHEPEPYAELPTPSRSYMNCLRLSVEHEAADFVEVVAEGMMVGEPPPAASLNGLIARYRIAYQCYADDDLIRVAVEFWDVVSDLWDRQESPWVQYLGARFAWPDPATVLARANGALRTPTRQERFEAPAFVELYDPPRRTAILTGGLPFYVRPHRRMADLLLVTATEERRFFEFALYLDPANSYAVLQSLLCPPVAMDATDRVPRGPEQGWFLHVDARNVHVLQLWPLDPNGKRFQLRLLETAGEATRTRVRFWRPIRRALLTDFLGEPLFEADLVDDGAEVDILANEVVQLEVEVG